MKVRNLEKTYRVKSGEETRALKGVSFDLPEKGLVFILGKSGSGKSTLLNLLGGLDSADGGEILVGGKNVAAMSGKELDAYRNSCCGFVFQEYNLIPELSVRDNLMLALELKEGKTQTDVLGTLDKVGLRGYADRKVTELSGGQRQRIAIARAIIKSPEIIFADEPTGALDAKTGREILELLKGLSRERLVVAVTHDRELAEEYGDRIIELADGEIISDSVQGYLSGEEKPYEARRPKLPVKAALKVGCSNFKYHPLRLFFTILFSVLSFTFLGVCLTVATTDSTAPYVNAVSNSGIDYVPLYKYTLRRDANGNIMHDDNFFNSMMGLNFQYTDAASFNADDIELIQSKTEMPVSAIIGVRIQEFNLRDYMPITIEEWNKIVPGLSDCYSAVSGIIHMNEAALKERNFTLMGTLPQAPDEIAINECLFNSFKLSGFKDRETGDIREINSVEDIIGCKVTKTDSYYDRDYFTITGVVDTGCDREWSREHSAHDKFNPGLTQNDYHERVFVSRDYAEEFDGLLLPLGSMSDFARLSKFVINYENDGVIYGFNDVISKEYVAALDMIMLSQNLSLWLSAIFGVFAVILLINFVAVSVRGQMKQIGILRAIGADFKSVCLTYGLSSAILFGAIFVLSCALLPAGIFLINKFMGYLKVTMVLFTFGILPVLLLFVIIAAVCAAGFFAPLLKMKKLTPSQVISRGQIK